MIPSEIEAITKEDNQEPETEHQILKIDNPINLALVGIQDETKHNRLKRMFKGKVLSIGIQKHRTIYSIRVRPPVSTLIKQGTKLVDDRGHEYKYRPVHRHRQTPKFSAKRTHNRHRLTATSPTHTENDAAGL